MPELESIYKCPVCLGIPLEKLKFRTDSDETILLDYCQRCGGMWFDQGEVEQMRHIRLQKFSQKVMLKQEDYLMPCHQCQTQIDRNLEKCPTCQWKNILECPVCLKAMKREEKYNLSLDYCKRCKGVWFDNIELASIWNGLLEHAVRSAKQSEQKNNNMTDVATDTVLLEALYWSPEIAFYGTQAAAHTLSHVPEVLSGTGDVLSQAPEVLGSSIEAAGSMFESIPEAAGSMFESIPEAAGSLFESIPEAAGSLFDGIGDAAGSIFEFIAEIIGGLFDG